MAGHPPPRSRPSSSKRFINTEDEDEKEDEATSRPPGTQRGNERRSILVGRAYSRAGNLGLRRHVGALKSGEMSLHSKYGKINPESSSFVLETIHKDRGRGQEGGRNHAETPRAQKENGRKSIHHFHRLDVPVKKELIAHRSVRGFFRQEIVILRRGHRILLVRVRHRPGSRRAGNLVHFFGRLVGATA